MEQIKQEWVDKYRPTSLGKYILDTKIKSYFQNMIDTKSLQNCTFLGEAGSGKTTLARILCNAFDAEVLFVKCATEGTVDVLRSKVEPFCNAMSLDGKIKIVLLDEIDSASSSGDNNFQKGLRTLIEAAQDDTRFILTANYNKIIPAILSRCPIIPLKFERKELFSHLKDILDNEKISYDVASLKQFVNESFKYCPDCRRIIKYLQLCSNSGTLTVDLNSVANNDKVDFIESIAKCALESKNILDVRRFYLQNKSKLSDYIEGASLLFNYAADNDLLDSTGLIKMADFTYQINMVVDKEPIFFGMLAALSKYKTHGIQV